MMASVFTMDKVMPMGLGDLFKKKRTNGKRRGQNDAEAEAVFREAEANPPRCVHYTFAHYAMRQVALSQPAAAIGVLGSDDAQGFLQGVWDQVVENCGYQAEDSDRPAPTLRVERFRVSQYPCAVLHMPTPQRMTEAHYVAMVLMARVDAGLDAIKTASLRYFTLEKGFDGDGKARTVLGEWTADDTHVNMGDGPEPDIASFVRAIERVL